MIWSGSGLDGAGCGNADLRQGGVELEDLALALHLPHTQLAGQLERGGAEALQGEGAVQVPLRAAPHLREGKLLRRDRIT